MLLPFPLVYSHGFDLNLGEHVFPTRKYGLIHDRLLSSHVADLDDFIAPTPIEIEDLLLVHEAQWVEKLRTSTLSLAEAMKLEIPYSQRTWEALRLATGGSLLAAREALTQKIAISIGGGFHHAFAGHGEGFCAIHDFGVAIRRLQKDKQISTSMVIDCDVHQGNGTAAIFAGDPTVFTFSIHQLNNYPEIKPPSNVDIDLADNTGDAEYLAKLGEAVHAAVAKFKPDLLFYVAGADPYMEDQLGGLLLTMDGLKKRDRLIYDLALDNKIPVATVLAGGYAFRTEDTVTIHCNTVRMASAAFDSL